MQYLSETPPNHPAINIRSPEMLAGVIHRRSLVDKRDLERLVDAAAGEPGKELWFWASAGYTHSAIKYAEAHSMVLLSYLETGDPIPENQLAADRLGSKWIGAK